MVRSARLVVMGPVAVSPRGRIDSLMAPEDRYAKDVVTFEALRAIIPKFRAKKSFIRVTEPVTPAIQREMGPSAPSAQTETVPSVRWSTKPATPTRRSGC